ncbi:hypothetical protein V3C99_014707 [Haemonchus contortus]
MATVFSTMYDCFYEMIMPLETCCLVERLTATLCFQSYEKNRKWFLLALSQPFCVGVAFLSNYIKRTPNADVYTIGVIAYYTIQFAGVIVLLYINRRLTTKYTGVGVSLSIRYQLAENIRALRVFLPMIAFDTMISLVDMVVIFLHIGNTFDSRRCETESNYLVSFILTTAVASALELIQSILIVCRYPNTTRVLFGCLSLSRNEVTSRGTGPIFNVLGSNLISQQLNTNHFDDLARRWSNLQ